MELKRDLGTRLVKQDRFNPLVETKCPKCRYPIIMKKDLSYGGKPHPLKCENDH